MTACGPQKGAGGERGTARPATAARVEHTRLILPEKDQRIALGQDIPLELAFTDSVQLDSVQVYLGGQLVFTLLPGTGFPEEGPLEALIPTSMQSLGRTGIRVKAFIRGGSAENQSRQLTLLADVPPREYAFRVLQEYPHDRNSYTQGLEYVDGYVYEGTGDYGTSYIRKVELESGKVLKHRDLDASLFGEGITLLNGRLYQLTYRSQVGFVYDQHTFEEINKVYYQNKEGWGLTNNGEELIMSDGTHVIYFLDPELFTVNRQMEVYTHLGPAGSLNELEYIDGKIWANRYYTDELVIIDPESGKVEGKVNLKGILKTSDRKPNTDVLNGIAWDAEGKRLFVTGKRWPKLFHIEVR